MRHIPDKFDVRFCRAACRSACAVAPATIRQQDRKLALGGPRVCDPAEAHRVLPQDIPRGGRVRSCAEKLTSPLAPPMIAHVAVWTLQNHRCRGRADTLAEHFLHTRWTNRLTGYRIVWTRGDNDPAGSAVGGIVPFQTRQVALKEDRHV